MLTLAGLTLGTGCFSPRDDGTGDPLEPPINLFGGDGGSPQTDAGVHTDGGTIDAPAGCGDKTPLSKMTVAVRTTAYGGRYNPRNIGAIWIEKPDGTFVKTIERWAAARQRYLTHFVAEARNNLVDAVTSATLSSHTTHTRVWNLTDVARCEVPTGTYKLVMETTDYDGTGAYYAGQFTLGTTATTATIPDSTNFHGITLTFQ